MEDSSPKLWSRSLQMKQRLGPLAIYPWHTILPFKLYFMLDGSNLLHFTWVGGWMGGCRMRLFLLVSLLGFHCCFAWLPRLDGSRLNYQCKSFLKRHKPLFIFFFFYTFRVLKCIEEESINLYTLLKFEIPVPIG